MIKFERIHFNYAGAEPVLADLSFTIEEGEKVVLLGANSSGKSTILKILNGLLYPSKGAYLFQGEKITAASFKHKEFSRTFRKNVVLLFQNPDAMLFNPTVFDEIAFGPRQMGMKDVEERVQKWAEELGIARHLDRPPFHLSGGEKQKVCLASLLVLDPEVLLLDEPTSHMDPRSTGWLVDFLNNSGMTTIITTHNLSLAGELGSRTIVLSEDHHLIYDGDLERLTGDTDLLLAANLMHVHGHKHGPVEHSHYHTHDWD